MTFYDLLWYFTIYSFLGWCSEVIFATVTTGKFVNRGFLNGPVCPIYGFGMSLVLLVLLPFSDNIPLLFIGGASSSAVGRSKNSSTPRGGTIPTSPSTSAAIFA